MTKQWDRQRDEDGELEPIKWFRRFQLYRALGPERSILAAYKEWQRSEGKRSEATTGAPMSWWDASRKWEWDKRAQAWDMEQERRRMGREQEAIDKMVQRHLNYALAMQSAASFNLDGFLPKKKVVKDSEGKEKEVMQAQRSLDASEVRQYVKEGVNLERIARGLPIEIIKFLMMTQEQQLEEYYKRHPEARRDPGDAPGESGDTGT